MSNNEYRIMPVSTNAEKAVTYQLLMQRYKKAMKEEFYFEALLITYGVLEDRLKSFLYHMGAIRDMKSKKLDTACKQQLRILCFGSLENAAKKRLDISQISGKAKIIEHSLIWAGETEYSDQDKYLLALKRELEGIDIGGMLDTLTAMKGWLQYRNEIIHGLFNKSMMDLDTDLVDEIEKGMKMARFIDSQIRVIKKKDNIRKAIKLPIIQKG